MQDVASWRSLEGTAHSHIPFLCVATQKGTAYLFPFELSTYHFFLFSLVDFVFVHLLELLVEVLLLREAGL